MHIKQEGRAELVVVNYDQKLNDDIHNEFTVETVYRWVGQVPSIDVVR